MTSRGGANKDGTVFSVPVTGGTPTVLYSFDDGTNGATPYGSLTLSGSTLYGMTSGGGTDGLGTVFKIPVTGGTPTTLFSFDATHGGDPQGSLTLSGSMLYGMTLVGGTSATSDGTVFAIPVTGGTPTVLYSFDGTYGANPWGSLTLSGSTLYGMTGSAHGPGYGTVFSIPVTGGTPTNLFSFDDTHGAAPYGDLTLSGSTLYGMTFLGGANLGGTAFSVPVGEQSHGPLLVRHPRRGRSLRQFDPQRFNPLRDDLGRRCGWRRHDLLAHARQPRRHQRRRRGGHQRPDRRPVQLRQAGVPGRRAVWTATPPARWTSTT